MPYDRLIKTNRIKLYRASEKEIKQLLQVAQRDLSTAINNLVDAPEA
jgi:hypothetical protein